MDAKSRAFALCTCDNYSEVTCILFSVVFTLSPQATTVLFGSYLSSLLLTNTVSPVRACPIIRWERFRGTQKEDDRVPLSIQSSLTCVILLKAHRETCAALNACKPTYFSILKKSYSG